MKRTFKKENNKRKKEKCDNLDNNEKEQFKKMTSKEKKSVIFCTIMKKNS